MSRVIAAFAQFFDGSGDPLASGFLRFLVSGTNNTLKDTYSDANQTLPNANPVQLDAEGRCPNVFGQGVYRVQLYNLNPVTGLPGSMIASFDPVAAEVDSGTSGTNFSEWDVATNYQVGNIVTRNGHYYKSITANNLGNDPETNPDQWEQISFVSFWNQYVSYVEGAIAVYNGQIYASLAGSNLNNQPDISPAWWNPPGAGTVLLNWEESGTKFQPKVAGYDLGASGNEVGTAWINDLGKFTETPATAPTADFQVANKKYSDDGIATKMHWKGLWSPGTYEEFDTVRDDAWTMIANIQTDERPAPQPVGDAEWVRDQFSPPAFLESSSNESVLYAGQRYTFVPAFLATNLRVWFPASAVGLNVEVWAVFNPLGVYRILNLFPGFQIDIDHVDKWVQLPFGQIYVENNTVVDILMVFRSPTAEVNFTYEWSYNKSNGDPIPGTIYHQGGSAVDEIRVHEQDSSLVDRTTFLDNVGPGSTIYMDASGYTWEVLSASKAGDVYTFIVDPGARANNALSDFTFTYFGASPINYVYNTNLYASDARIQGFFANEYDPTDVGAINENGYGIDIQLQTVIVSDDWDVVAQPSGGTAVGGGSQLGYWQEEDAHWQPITDNVGYLGNTDKLIQNLYMGDSSPASFGASQAMTIQHDGSDGEIDLTTGGLNIATTGSEIITFNDELIYSANNGPLAGFRNKIINGCFRLWQRATSQTTNATASDDRWYNSNVGSTKTHSRQAFTLGQTDVPGNPKYFSRTVVTTGSGAADYVFKQQRIEFVATLAGQTVALSFHAKADSAKNIATEFNQYFGTGGAPSTVVNTIGVTTHILSASWQKFTAIVALPSISGKVLGTSNNDSLRLLIWFDAGSNFDARTNSLGNQSGTFDIAQIQLEPGPYVTPFESRFIGIEKILCYRFYKKLQSTDVYAYYGIGNVTTTTNVNVAVHLGVQMRRLPSFSFSNVTDFRIYSGSHWVVPTAMVASRQYFDFVSVQVTGSGFVERDAGILRAGNTTNAWIAFSAEI